MKRREFILMVSAAVAWPLAVRAQQVAKIYRVGLLGTISRIEYAHFLDAFERGLGQFGYVLGRNIVLMERWAEGRYERLPELAAELVRLNPDAIVTHGTPGSRALKNATSSVPGVMIGPSDPVAAGLVSNLVRPGGNLTGLTFFFPEMCAKRLEFIKEAVPGIKRVAVIVNPTNNTSQMALASMERTAQHLLLELKKIEIRKADELEGAFTTIAQVGALAVVEEPLLNASARRIAELSIKHRIPMAGFRDHVQAGGLIGYGVDLRDLWSRAAFLVDKILKGTKPANIPVEQAVKFELFLNAKTAKILGLTLPPTLLARADEVIE